MEFKKEEIIIFEEIKKYIYNHNNILICSHKSPDGDAIGSAISIKKFIENCRNINNDLVNTNVKVLFPTEISYQYKWLTENEDIIIAETNLKLAEEAFKSADLIIASDFNEPLRLSMCKDFFETSKAKKVVIDHHPLFNNEYDVIYNSTETSSASELVFNLLSYINLNCIDDVVATYLYIGIITDTGSLSYSCNYASTYNAISILIGTGIKGDEIHNKIFNYFPIEKTRLLGHILKDKLVVNPEYHYSYYTLTKKELCEYGYKPGYLSNVVNYALNINNIFVAASFEEKEDGITKISFRSRDGYKVNQIARDYFGGGGHMYASGADYKGSIEDAVKLFEEIIKLNINKIDCCR
ncbi:MAG: DHH family phosphoesterase [Bacteroidales bacterium]